MIIKKRMNNPFGDSLRTNGTLPDDAFIGMELDGKRSQYHFNARSYDPHLSGFFAPDLLFVLSSLQTWRELERGLAVLFYNRN